MKNWRATVLSQYDNSARMLALMEGFNAHVDPASDIDAFYQAVFDPRTATGWGLDVWGRIVGVGRLITLEGSSQAFGFYGSGLLPFGQAPFWSDNATNNYLLADEAFRLLIFMKAAINITDGTLSSLNRIMAGFFADRGAAMVLHVGTMKIRFLFRFQLEPYERALLSQESVTPKPAGVGFDVYEVPVETFGFFGSGLMPFGQGTFVQGDPQDAYSV